MVVWPQMARHTTQCKRPNRLLLAASCMLATATLGAGARQPTATAPRTVLIRTAQIIDGRGGPPIDRKSVV